MTIITNSSSISYPIGTTLVNYIAPTDGMVTMCPYVNSSSKGEIDIYVNNYMAINSYVSGNTRSTFDFMVGKGDVVQVVNYYEPIRGDFYFRFIPYY